MVHNHIGLEIELGNVHCDIVLLIVESLVHVLFNFVFKVSINGMIEQVFPLNSFFRINGEHFSDNVLSDLRYLIDVFGKTDRFVFDVVDQVYHVAGFVWRSAKKNLIKHYADRPDVSLAVVLSAA